MSYLLRKYSRRGRVIKDLDKMSRLEKLRMLEDMIAVRAKKARIIKPALHSHINRMLPDDLVIMENPIIDAKHDRTTIDPPNAKGGLSKHVKILSKETSDERPTNLELVGTTNSHQISLEQTESTGSSNMKDPNMKQLREIAITLTEMKKKYEAMKLKFLKRLRELNERKVKLARRRKVLLKTTKAPRIELPTPSEKLVEVAVEYPESPVKFDGNEIVHGVLNTISIKPIPKFSNFEKLAKLHTKSRFQDSNEDVGIPPSSKILSENESPDLKQSSIEEQTVIPLVRKYETAVTPLQEFEIVTATPQKPQRIWHSQARRIFMSTLSDANAQPHAIVFNDRSQMVAPHSQRVPSDGVKIGVKPLVPRAKPPPPVKGTEARVYSAPTKEIDEDDQSLYLRDGDVKMKTRHEGKTTQNKELFKVAQDIDQLPTTKAESTEPIPPPEMKDGSVHVHNQVEESLTNSDLVYKLQEELLKKTRNEYKFAKVIEGGFKAKGVKIQSENEEQKNALDELFEPDEQAVCKAIECNFEKENLCEWTPSLDFLSPASRHYLLKMKFLHRNRRKIHYVQRTWHNWRGRYRNRVTGIARARVFSGNNQRFAAAYVRPHQRATLTGNILSGAQETVRFRSWEATRDVQLRVCCDTIENCVFETDLGVRKGTRRWLTHSATCPKGTTKIIFECVNHGVYQGACGLDDVHLLNDSCPKLIPFNEQRRKLVK